MSHGSDLREKKPDPDPTVEKKNPDLVPPSKTSNLENNKNPDPTLENNPDLDPT